MSKSLRIVVLVVVLLVIAANVLPDYKHPTNILGYPCEKGFGLRALVTWSLIFGGFAVIAWHLFWPRLPDHWPPPDVGPLQPFDPDRPFNPILDNLNRPFDPNQIGLQYYWEHLFEPAFQELVQILGVGIGAFVCFVSLTLC